MVEDSEGNRMTSLADIHNTFIRHYRSLWSSDRTGEVQIRSLGGPLLSAADADSLTKPVPEDEIWRAVRALPGIDGFGASRAYWKRENAFLRNLCPQAAGGHQINS